MQVHVELGKADKCVVTGGGRRMGHCLHSQGGGGHCGPRPAVSHPWAGLAAHAAGTDRRCSWKFPPCVTVCLPLQFFI